MKQGGHMSVTVKPGTRYTDSLHSSLYFPFVFENILNKKVSKR